MAAEQRFQAELSFGLDGLRGGALWTPFVSGETGSGREAYRLGVKLTSGNRAEAGLEFGWRHAASGPPEQAVELRGVLRW